MPTIPVAYILLEDARLPNEGALIETLRARHPDLQWGRSTVTRNDSTDGPLFIRAGDHLMTILMMPAPMPFDQQLWQRASWLWPDALQAAGRHRAHLIVSTMGSAETNAETKVLGFAESTHLTTALVGAVLKRCLAVSPSSGEERLAAPARCGWSNPAARSSRFRINRLDCGWRSSPSVPARR